MRPEVASASPESVAGAADVAPGFVLEGVPWVVYRILRALPTSRNVRMTYLDGTLYLMSPEYIHEQGASNLSLLVLEVAQALSLDFEPTRTTTLRRKGRGKRRGAGKEPDEGFYVGIHAELMRGRDAIKLSNDPPPDLAIEVDNKADSSAALSTYARLRVPEVWRYRPRQRTLWFGMFNGQAYEPIARSLALPMLTPELVLHALDARTTGKQSFIAWKSWLAEWARTLPLPPPGDRPGTGQEE
jgi:Uma2 family endonuclease